MPQTAKFKQAISRLNPAQRQAADAIEGPVMVIAGPGSGKTQILATRIANILVKTDTSAHNILALTFTESAAKNMRQRLVELIGVTGYQPTITTFHSFCREVIARFPEYFPVERASEPLSEIEKFQLISQLIAKAELEVLQPINAPDYYLRQIVRSIADLKREGVSPDAYQQLIETEFTNIDQLTSKTEKMRQQKNQQKNLELLQIYRAYQKFLRAQKRLDFEDMISLVLEALKNQPLLKAEYQELYHYFLIDEYQDTNSAQNQVVMQLASYWQEQANVFVVGDPHQSIFRFQGASLENISAFLHQFPNAQIITLETGYRCPQFLYDVAHFSIGQGLAVEGEKTGEALQTALALLPDKPLVAAHKSASSVSKPIRVWSAPSRLAELMWVGEQVQQLLAKGVDPSQIAVLYRNNFESFELMELFDKQGVRYEVAGGGNVLQTESIRQLIKVLTVIEQLRTGSDHPDLFEIFLYDWLNLDSLTVYQLAKQAGRAKVSLVEAIQKIKQPDLQTDQLVSRYQTLLQLGLADAKQVLTETFVAVIKETGYLDWLKKQPNRIELMLNLNALYSEVKALSAHQPGAKLADLLTVLNLMQNYRLSLDAEDLNIESGAVHLSTVHKAKGREWQYVFVIGLVDGVWGNAKRRELITLPAGVLPNLGRSCSDADGEERRLFYVAITRAKQVVNLSYAETAVINQQTRELLPSQFVVELNQAEKLENIDGSEFLQEAQEKLESWFTPGVREDWSEAERQFFQDQVESLGLSVSSLNKYLADPVAFVYDVLLRLPKAKEAPMVFGSAVHAALELANRKAIETGEPPPVEKVLAVFEQNLKAEPLAEAEQKRRLALGRQALTTYLGTSFSPANILSAEQFFGSGAHKTYLDDIRLTGRVDRIDRLGEKAVKVIDYKTGRARSVNWIEGKTKSANLSEREQQLDPAIRGAYKRQLLFYKLLAQLDPSFKSEVTHGEFIFVQPDKDSEKIVVRNFELAQKDVELLKDLIRQVMQEIRSLEFLQWL